MLEEIKKRRSIRKFTDKKVDDGIIENLLKAAMSAPTARNTQSWRFIVVTNRDALNAIADHQASMNMMKTAYCAIIVMGDREASQPDEYLYVDSAAAIENMLLEAVHLGLGTCWCAIGPKTDRIKYFRESYQISEQYVPIAAVAVGYPDEEKEAVDRYDQAKVSWHR